MNIGYAPVVTKAVAALERDSIAHVAATYLSAETYTPANAGLIDAQSGIDFAQAPTSLTYFAREI